MSSDRKVPDDHELEDFLAGRHPVGRAYREVSEHETAPRELDDAILRMAREHAATSTPTARVTRRPRWLQPLAVAATLALSLGVLMNIWRDPALREQVAPMEEEEEAPPGVSQTESAGPVGSPKPAADADAAARQREEAARAKLLRELESQPDRAFAIVGGGQEAERRSERALADTLPPSATAPRSGASMAPATPPPPPPPAPAPSVAAEPPAAASSGAGQSRPYIDPHARDRDAELSFPAEMRKLESDDASPVERRAPLSTSAPAKSASPAPEMQEQKKQASRRADEAPSLAKEASAPEPIAEDAAAAGTRLERTHEDRPTRESLVERARVAVARGDRDEARRLVAELRRLYPEVELPEDLRALAPPER